MLYLIMSHPSMDKINTNQFSLIKKTGYIIYNKFKQVIKIF